MPWMALATGLAALLVTGSTFAQVQTEFCEDLTLVQESLELSRDPGQDDWHFESHEFVPDYSGQGVGFEHSLRVRIDKLTDFNLALEAKVNEARKILDLLFQSERFYHEVINFTYRGQKAFLKNQGYTNLEIYNLIQWGQERRTHVADQIMSLDLVMYYKDSKTIGYTDLWDSPIYVNLKHYGSYSVPQIARNLMHEWLHNMGFSHSGFATIEDRANSVPYGVGYIVERLARSL